MLMEAAYPGQESLLGTVSSRASTDNGMGVRLSRAGTLLRNLRELFSAGLAVVWIVALCNHSYIHYGFAFRTMAPCALGLMLALTPAKGERAPFLKL